MEYEYDDDIPYKKNSNNQSVWMLGLKYHKVDPFIFNRFKWSSLFLELVDSSMFHN